MDLKIFATFAAPLLTALIAFLLNKHFQHKPKLIAYYGNIAAHKMPIYYNYPVNTVILPSKPEITFLDSSFRDKIPLIIKIENDENEYWLYGATSDGSTKLTKISSPEKYNQLSFTKNVEKHTEVSSELYKNIRLTNAHNAIIVFGTHEVVVRNTGKLSARNLRLGHKFLPNFHIMPNIKYEVTMLSLGGAEIIFPVLVPNEQITISYLYNPPTTYIDINTYVKSDEGLAKIIQVIPSPNLSTWQKVIIYTLLFIGGWTLIYMVIIILFSIFKLLSC